MRVPIVTAVSLLALGAAVPGCGDDGTPVEIDAMQSSVCPGQLLLTGEYVDWDSTVANFDGIEDTMVTEVGNASNTATTAPNGRLILCLPSGVTSTLDFAQGSYVPLRYTATPEVMTSGVFALKGFTPARATALFTDDLGDIAVSDQRAHVLVAVFEVEDPVPPLLQAAASPPAIGAQVAIGNGNDGSGGFTDNGTGTYAAGTTLTDDRFVFFPNVEIAGGTTTISLTAPAGKTCDGPGSIPVIAGRIAATTFACRDR